MSKRFISVILSLMIVTVFMPAFAFAEGNDISDGYSVFFINDNDIQAYTGNMFKPDFVVIDNEFWLDGPDYVRTYEHYISDDYSDTWREDCTLPSDKYEVTYPDDCINRGDKTITITGKNGYTGTLTASYYISPKEITFTKTKNDDKSVTFEADSPIDLSGAVVWLFNEDYYLKSDEFTVSDNKVAVDADFLRNYISVNLNHKIRIETGNYYGDSVVRSYNISGLPGLGNIKKVYNGKQKSLTDLDLGINDAKLGTEYKVVYAKSARKAIGKYKYTVKGKGDYIGSLKGTFEIIPKAPAKITSAKRTGSKATVKWKKVSNCSGYQVQLIRYSSAESDMPDYTVYKSSFVKGKGNLSKTFTKVKKSRFTKARVRSYKLVGGKKIYSKWKYKKF